jgi:SAM-dependent methyltransferase
MGKVNAAEELATRSQEFMAKADWEEADRLLTEAIELRAADRPADFASWRPQQVSDFFAAIMFTGGPPHAFELVGRQSLADMISHGLYPDSRVLDIGCGSLRLGYWLINFLQPDRYFGIDPERARVQWGLDYLLGRDLVEAKRPRFDYNRDLDFSVFGERFDFFVARSIWTHAGRAHITAMLEGFAAHATPEAVFLASYVPAKEGDGYLGADWVGMPLVQHRSDWIAKACEHVGLVARDLAGDLNGQTWVRVEHASVAHRPLPESLLMQQEATAPGRVRRLLARRHRRSTARSVRGAPRIL